jgi:cyclic pyranopterin phosphate synthase
MTTNAVLLSKYAADLKKAGQRRVNISLDTLQAEKYKKICRGKGENGDINQVLEGIETAHQVGLTPVKINVVVMKDVNDDEIMDFARKTIDEEWHVRFIELMPYSGQDGNTPSGLSSREIKKRIDPLGKMEPYKHTWGNGPANNTPLPDAKGTIVYFTAIKRAFLRQHVTVFASLPMANCGPV